MKDVSFRQIGAYHLYLTVALARRDYLQPWYRSAALLVASCFSILLTSVLMAMLFYRSAKRSRMAARALAAQERKYHTIADYTYDWEFWIDTQGTYVYVSPSCERITGYKPSEFLLDPGFLAALIHPDDRDAYLRHPHLSGPDAGFATMAFRIRRADGETRWIEHLCRPIVSPEGAWLGTRGTNRDMTERREAEDRIRALLEEKEIILKEVHHRIKNNMTIVSSLLDMQSGSTAEVQVADALKTASNRIRSMALLYDRLYRSEAGNAASLREYMSALLREIHGTFPGREKVGLSLDLEDVTLDSVRLSRIGIILNELLTNSMKYAFEGRQKGRISVRARREGTALRIEYEDDGVGFALEKALNEAQAGFGLILLAGLAKQLKGRVEMRGENGFRYAIAVEL